MSGLFGDSAWITPGMAIAPSETSFARSWVPGGGSGIREEALWQQKAAQLLLKTLQPLRKAIHVAGVQMVRLRRDSGRDFTLEFVAELMIPQPMRKARIYIPVKIADGEPVIPNQFQDSAGRSYKLCEAAIRGLVTGYGKDHWDSRKMPPRAGLSFTDRTLLPTVPARSFFTLASKTGKAVDQRLRQTLAALEIRPMTAEQHNTGILANTPQGRVFWIVDDTGNGQWVLETTLPGNLKWGKGEPLAREDHAPFQEQAPEQGGLFD